MGRSSKTGGYETGDDVVRGERFRERGGTRRWGPQEWGAYRRGWLVGKRFGREEGKELAREHAARRDGRLLRVPEAAKLAGISRATIYRLERAGRFPRRVQISENAVGWHEHEVRAWKAVRSRRGGGRRDG
jgi:prophage regulatory protein